MFGVSRDSRGTVDQGVKRTPGQILAMHGEKNGKPLASACRALSNYKAGRVITNATRVTEVQEALWQHPGIREAVRAVSPLVREFRVSVGEVATAFFVCFELSSDDAETFLRKASTGLNLEKQTDPIYRLRIRYQKHKDGGKIHPEEQAALFIKAFNYYRSGKTVRNLRWRDGGNAAEAFPVPQ